MTLNQLDAKTIFSYATIIPVMVIDQLELAVPQAEALYAGGIKVLEVTLRTPSALEAIDQIRRAIPDAIVGAGTVLNTQDFRNARNAGAQFVISPGLTSCLLSSDDTAAIPLIPGVSSASNIMLGLEHGYECFKFFPAEASGGIDALKSFQGPFPTIQFCPTGGVNSNNFRSYLQLSNVGCVGGSWILPKELIAQQKWNDITSLCREMIRIGIKNQ